MKMVVMMILIHAASIMYVDRTPFIIMMIKQLNFLRYTAIIIIVIVKMMTSITTILSSTIAIITNQMVTMRWDWQGHPRDSSASNIYVNIKIR